ncbi:DUF6624 domain-containing protein [Actinacidiphila sp. ITFR-21]|uniref:DUF6624 domain-containing protein n=1 Tax=Actinacidiphila sp. ITFR-21 TaxID=3075199 RepID=UPI002889D3BC|nr:DUF6624 domain-containing protein [Streptomyces sp. ITFR-21]WNI19966.1 hypothetical protein RLT57_30970 [Streptomyces sp. ITFR-21]
MTTTTAQPVATASAAPSRPHLRETLMDCDDNARRARPPDGLIAVLPPHQLDAVLTHALELDEHNAGILRRIVTALGGWPGRAAVADDGCRAALGIALRCDHDPDFQRMLLAMLNQAAREGDASSAQWARLSDRVQVNAGQLQTYGTQFRYGPSGVEPCPIADPDGLDTRRASVGLPPHDEQFARLRRRHEPGRGPVPTPAPGAVFDPGAGVRIPAPRRPGGSPAGAAR